jgi:hypothetical protein
VDPIFIPQLEVKIHDNVIFGLAMPVLAQGTIDLPALSTTTSASPPSSSSASLFSATHHEDDHVEEVWEYHHFRAPPNGPVGSLRLFSTEFEEYLENPSDRRSTPKVGSQVWEWVDRVSDADFPVVVLDLPVLDIVTMPTMGFPWKHRGQHGTMDAEVAEFNKYALYDIMLGAQTSVGANGEGSGEFDSLNFVASLGMGAQGGEGGNSGDIEEVVGAAVAVGDAATSAEGGDDSGTSTAAGSDSDFLGSSHDRIQNVRMRGCHLQFDKARFYGWRSDGEGWVYARSMVANHTNGWSAKCTMFHHVRRRRWTRRRARKVSGRVY